MFTQHTRQVNESFIHIIIIITLITEESRLAFSDFGSRSTKFGKIALSVCNYMIQCTEQLITYYTNYN